MPLEKYARALVAVTLGLAAGLLNTIPVAAETVRLAADSLPTIPKRVSFAR
jgi:hypothetical protein